MSEGLGSFELLSKKIETPKLGETVEEMERRLRMDAALEKARRDIAHIMARLRK